MTDGVQWASIVGARSANQLVEQGNGLKTLFGDFAPDAGRHDQFKAPPEGCVQEASGLISTPRCISDGVGCQDGGSPSFRDDRAAPTEGRGQRLRNLT
jgi:hypothetical protein